MGRRKNCNDLLRPAIPAGFEIMNEETFNDYFYRIAKIALSIFEWVNLPSSMDGRMLEIQLFKRGMAALLYDEEKGGYINTGATKSGYINIYGLPTALNCYSFNYSKIRRVYSGKLINGQGEEINEDKNSECILVKNNALMLPTDSSINLFAARLANAERLIDVNLSVSRTPLLILTDEKQRFTVEQIYNKYQGNAPVIIGNKATVNRDDIKVLKTDAPFLADKLITYKRQIWNECLSFLGIDNTEEKKERLVASEVDQNNEQVNLNMESYLSVRKEACEQFNEKYGMDIDVRVRSDLHNLTKLVMNEERNEIDLNTAEEKIDE